MNWNCKNILSGLIDILFPPRCLLCGSFRAEVHGGLLCNDCFSRISFAGSPLCPCCGLPFQVDGGSNHLCGECAARKQPFSRARSLARYENTMLEAVHLFKYRGNRGIGRFLGKLMAEHGYDDFDIGRYSRIMPVPLHPAKLRKRGFNQALVLARRIAERYSLPLDFSSLARKTDTSPQVGLEKKDRLLNVRGAFTVTNPEAVRGERILLIDDVYTTGSTVKECARVLRCRGAREVAVLTLARA